MKLAGLIPCLILTALSAGSVQARTWERIDVPGASCGDGSPYSFFVSRKNPKRLAFEFQGGGACWNGRTCFGPVPLARLKEHSVPPEDGFNSDSKSLLKPKSPVADDTLIYFPYCTADVHVGTHVIAFSADRAVHFVGRNNTERAVAAFTELTGLSWNVDRVVVYGYSAGAIGAMHHVYTLSPKLGRVRDKSVILDAPGLAFGPDMWKKFPPELVSDFERALEDVGDRFDRADGNVAQTIASHCRFFNDWRFGVLQGSRDVVMSWIFGNTTPKKEEAMIFGPGGLRELTADPNDHCSSWIPRTYMHTFLRERFSEGISADGLSAIEYIRAVIAGVGLASESG